MDKSKVNYSQYQKVSASWTVERTSFLVRHCHGEVTRGAGDGNGLKLQVRNRILVKFNLEAKVSYVKAQLSSKLSDLRSKYKSFDYRVGMVK